MSPPEDPAFDTLVKQGYDQLTAGRFEEAVETFSASLMVGPREANALRGRALAYAQLKQWALAAKDFSVARDVNPDETDNWVDLGVCLAMDNQAYPAIAVFEALLTNHPACLRAHLELGRLHLRLGAIPKGREHLQQALASRPTLDQRRLIEFMLSEQDTLDKKRLYRPDFAAFHQQPQRASSRGLIQTIRAWFRRRWSPSEDHAGHRPSKTRVGS